MLNIPGPPPVPGPDENWTEFPNDFDRRYLAWREEVENFARELRAQFFTMQANPIPMSKYKDGDHKFKWQGKAYPVSKHLYTWMTKSAFDKNDRAVEILKDSLIDRARYTNAKS